MTTGLSLFFNIEKDEKSIVIVLLLQSVFLGIFAGAFDVGAHSLFLKVYDASLIPGAFVLSGLTGIFITSVYTRLQRSMKFSSFMILNLGFVAFIALLLRLGFVFFNSGILVYIVFVLMGPLTIISFLGFWGNVSRIFTLRQGKRLFGIIDTGQIIGIILASYAIPVLMSLQFAILDTLLISGVSIIIALIIQLFISRKAQFSDRIAQKKMNKTVTKTGFFHLFSSRYTLLITLFVFFSVTAAFFVHYSFISVTKLNYPEPENFASFLGAFMGTLMIFTIIIKTFLYGRLMKMYGLRFALLISPVLLGTFTLIAFFAGSFYGLESGTAGFTLFFILLALSKLFVKSLKDSIEAPSSKILYQSLKSEIKYDVQARIDGTINEVSAFFSGLILAGLGLLAAINLLHYTAVLVIVLVLWGITGTLLYKAYRGSLYDALKRYKESGEVNVSSIKPTQKDENVLKGERLFYSIRLMPQLWNGFLTRNFKLLLNNPDKRIADEISSLIDRLGIPDEELNNLTGDINKSKELDESEEVRIKTTINYSEIQDLLNSNDISFRKRAIYMISKSDDKNIHARLIPFFRDYDPVIMASAIHAAGSSGNSEIAHYLIDLFEDRHHYATAFHAIVKLGPKALDSLENSYYKTGITNKALRRITKTIACIDSEQKYPILLGKLDHSSNLVINEALAGLTNSGFRPAGTDISRLIPKLRKVVDIAAKNFALMVSLRTCLPEAAVTCAIEEEYRENVDMIFSFLSLAYDPQSIYHIRQNYESGTAEGIGFAIELLDLFIDETINPFLFPLFEDSTDYEKIKNLQAEYYVEILKTPDVLFSILNSDLNQIGFYSRICALNELLNLKDYKLTNEVIAQAFHPDSAIREAAVSVITHLNPELLMDIQKRTESNYKQANLLYKGKTTNHSVISKIKILEESKTFSFLKRKLLPEFARKFELSSISSFRNKRLLEIFNNIDVIFISKGDILFKSSSGKLIKSEKDELFMISEINRMLGEDCFINSMEGLEFMRISEDDLRELFFDFENVAAGFIDKLKLLNDRADINTRIIYE